MLDQPDVVTKGAVLDLAPTLTMYDDTSKEFAAKYVWRFLHVRLAPMPEHLISPDPGLLRKEIQVARRMLPKQQRSVSCLVKRMRRVRHL